MQRLGRVLHATPSRNIVVKVENVPKIGEKVVDENMKPIGNVFDIIGPIRAPYAIIKPTIKEVKDLVSKTLYTLPLERRREKMKNE
ncbi:MAG: Gar1/Naf1 family protein [Candidatus Bathyarchaeia archaeon]